MEQNQKVDNLFLKLSFSFLYLYNDQIKFSSF